MTVLHKSADIDKELFHNERLWRPQDVLSRKHAASQRAQANSVLFLKIPSLVLFFFICWNNSCCFYWCYDLSLLSQRRGWRKEASGSREAGRTRTQPPPSGDKTNEVQGDVARKTGTAEALDRELTQLTRKFLARYVCGDDVTIELTAHYLVLRCDQRR